MGKADASGSFGRDQVIKIINSVIHKVEHAGDGSREAIHEELRNLQQIIVEARKDLGMARAADIKDKHIPTATDELDAIVAATAAATGTIMDACEKIEATASAVGGNHGQGLSGEVTKIYEACSFQDITGQRIKKVVSTLQTIEAKVDRLMTAIGEKMPGDEECAGACADEDTRTGDAALLNGPQMADKAITQDEIDRLLSEFG